MIRETRDDLAIQVKLDGNEQQETLQSGDPLIVLGHSLSDAADGLQQIIARGGEVDSATGTGRDDPIIQLAVDENAWSGNDPLILLSKQLDEAIASLEEMILQICGADANSSTPAADIPTATTQYEQVDEGKTDVPGKRGLAGHVKADRGDTADARGQVQDSIR